MIIYMLTNIVNGKRYVGLTVCALEKRLREHRCAARTGLDNLVYRAIRKHGWDAFRVEVLATADSVEELALLEIKYIALYKAADRNFGYNMTLGGQLGTSRLYTLKGEDVAQAKATNEAAIFIRCFDPTQPNRVVRDAVEERFGIVLSRDCVRDIRRGDSFQFLDAEYPPVRTGQGGRQATSKEEMSTRAKLQLIANPRAAARFREAARQSALIPKSKKLTEEQVLAIYNDPRPGTVIAREYGTDRSMPNKIRSGACWGYITKHVKRSAQEK